MKNLKFKLIGLFLIGALFSLTTNSFGQQGQGMGQGMGQGRGQGNGYGNGYGRGYLCNDIPNLTIEQKNKIEKLRIVHFKEKQTNRNLFGEKKARLQTLRSADKVDMTAINKTIDEMTALQGTMSKQREQHIQDVRNLLDDEQKVYFDSFSRGNGNGQGYGRGRGNRGGRGNGRGCGRGNW